MTPAPTDLAIIAGEGRLPRLLAAAAPDAVRLRVCEVSASDPFAAAPLFRLERLVPILDDLWARGVRRLCFSGAATRPSLDPELFDSRSAQLVPRFISAMSQGDDAALRVLIEIVREWEFTLVAPEDIMPELLPGPGWLTATPVAESVRASVNRDADRAAEILSVTSDLDIGQGCVVAQGLCLGIETLPGTEAMLGMVARYRQGAAGAGGVLYKAPKRGQQAWIDRPAIGPDTVDQAAAAGLAALVWPAGEVLVLDRADTIARADARGLLLWSRGQTDAD